MDIIPIQASSVSCERVFSSGKETMSARRNRISGELMEQLQILKFSIKKGRPLNFTAGMNWKDELQTFEYLACTDPAGEPESYRRSLEVSDGDSDEMEDLLEDILSENSGKEEQGEEGEEEDFFLS
jgi:hAT family C-terminal dimerisation region